jgi:hypothetical protein
MDHFSFRHDGNPISISWGMKSVAVLALCHWARHKLNHEIYLPVHKSVALIRIPADFSIHMKVAMLGNNLQRK